MSPLKGLNNFFSPSPRTYVLGYFLNALGAEFRGVRFKVAYFKDGGQQP